MRALRGTAQTASTVPKQLRSRLADNLDARCATTMPDAIIEDITRQNSLVQLPLKYRWEFVRRHPVYLVCWKLARSYLKGEIPTARPEEQSTAYAALLLLQTMGVTGEPVDPATTSEQLEEDNSVAPEFLAGPVQPMTYRAMLLNQIMALPTAELAAIAALFNVASNTYREEGEVETEEAAYARRLRAAAQLNALISPVLDSFPKASLYYIDPNASTRVISAAVNRIMRLWKRRNNVSEQRLQLKSFDEALTVWDRREGWTGAGYDLSRVENNSRIAQSLSKSRSTLVSRHATAFSWIIGTPYTVERWMRLFFAYHRYADSSNPSSGYIKRLYRSIAILKGDRGSQDPSVTTSSEPYVQSLLRYTDVALSEVDMVDFSIDVRELIDKGKTDEEIAHILELPIVLINYIRSHLETQN